MRSKRPRIWVGPWVAAFAACNGIACSQQPITVPLRSLEQSGAFATLCLTWDDRNPAAEMAGCAEGVVNDIPRDLYALVTQTSRGEVALIDLTAHSVVDLDPSRPGFSFIPVGARPVDIVSSPGSSVTFVGCAEPNKNAIYVLPSTLIRHPAPTLTTFFACALPSAPGAMKVLVEPFGSGAAAHTTCDGVPLDGVEHPWGDLARESNPPGTRKLLVVLPDLGDVAILDAQELMDRKQGSFEPCRIERLIHLRADRPSVLPQQRTPEGGWPPGTAEDGGPCPLTVPESTPVVPADRAHPAAVALDDDGGLLYVADDNAPVIHVLDVTSPCNPVERDPLLPMSVENPDRVVTTREIAVSPPTSDGKKFLYATDFREGSLMAFDVSTDSTDRTPLQIPYPDRNPSRPRDRLWFGMPIRQIAFFMRDNPIADAVTGVAPRGQKCDPDINSSGLGVGYRTGGGVGPLTLRGIYAAAVLANGLIEFVDVDDFDAPCRRPQSSKPGVCQHETYADYQGANGELSCQVIERHQARNGFYFQTGDTPRARMPGMQSYAVLSLNSSSLAYDAQYPKLLAPAAAGPDDNAVVQVGGKRADVEFDPTQAKHHMVRFDLREPRAHPDQDWSVVFEGAIGGFDNHVARLRPNAAPGGHGIIEDSEASFCSRGVHDLDAVANVAQSLGIDRQTSDSACASHDWALCHVDVLQITDAFLDRDDPYWASVASQCTYASCQDLFGLPDAVKPARESPILEAYQDHVVIADPLGMASCCFPTLVTYTVRAREQWIVHGGFSGFLHQVAIDPKTGRCIDSCDPVGRARHGRVLEGVRIESSADADKIPKWDSAQAFRNPMMQFWIHPGTSASVRDMAFAFSANGGFTPLFVNLASTTTYVQPQAVRYLPEIGELAISDGSAQGLMLVNLASLALDHSYY